MKTNKEQVKEAYRQLYEIRWKKALKTRRDKATQGALYEIETEFPDGIVRDRKELRYVCKQILQAAEESFRACYECYFEHLPDTEPIDQDITDRILSEFKETGHLAVEMFIRFIRLQSKEIMDLCNAGAKVEEIEEEDCQKQDGQGNKSHRLTLFPERNFSARLNEIRANAEADFRNEKLKRQALIAAKQKQQTDSPEKVASQPAKRPGRKPCKQWSPIRSLPEHSKQALTVTILPDPALRAKCGDIEITASLSALGLDRAWKQMEVLTMLATEGYWQSDLQAQGCKDDGRASKTVNRLNETLKRELGCQEEFVFRHRQDGYYRPRSGFQIQIG